MSSKGAFVSFPVSLIQLLAAVHFLPHSLFSSFHPLVSRRRRFTQTEKKILCFSGFFGFPVFRRFYSIISARRRKKTPFAACGTAGKGKRRSVICGWEPPGLHGSIGRFPGKRLASGKDDLQPFDQEKDGVPVFYPAALRFVPETVKKEKRGAFRIMRAQENTRNAVFVYPAIDVYQVSGGKPQASSFQSAGSPDPKNQLPNISHHGAASPFHRICRRCIFIRREVLMLGQKVPR